MTERRSPGVVVFRIFLKLLPESTGRHTRRDVEGLFVWQLSRVRGRLRRIAFIVAAIADLLHQAIALRVGRAIAGTAESSGTGRGRWRPGRVVEPVAYAARLALRNLVRQPGFTLPVVATLGLGIGMAAAMAAVVSGVLLRPLPYPDSDRLVVVRERTEQGGLLPASYLNFDDWRSSGRSFTALGAVVGPRNAVVLGGLDPARVPAMFVSSDFFRAAGVDPAIGRLPGDDENRPGGPATVVISHRFWQASLGGRAISDASLTLQDLFGGIESYAVIGVMPAGFDLLGSADVYVPLDRAVPWNVRGNHVVNVVGRLSPGATIESAARELDGVQARIQTASAGETEAIGVGVSALHDDVVGSIRTPVLLLLIGALLLLATAFFNVAGAMLARGVSRRTEFSVRVSLGATQRRILLQLVVESGLYAACGLVAGLLVAKTLLALLTVAAPPDIPRLDSMQTTWLQLTASGALLVAIGMLLFGVATAAISTRDPGALRDRSGVGTRGGRTVWRILVMTEVAVALMLLATAGVLGRSLRGILVADTGFDASMVVTASINLPPRAGAEESDIVRYFDTALTELRSMAGIESAGMSNLLPLPGISGIGGPVIRESGETTNIAAQYRVAEAGFFETLGISLVRGRVFDERDVAGAAHAVVINTTMAEQLFGTSDPIGQRFNLGGMDPYRDDWLTIVGVVEEARPWTVPAGGYPVYYVDYRQRPIFLAFTTADIVVRVRDVALADEIRRRLAAIDPDIPVSMRSLEERMASQRADRRFVLALLGLFAVLALALTAVGIWGVVSFIASRRTRDMTIRLALGASPSRVLRGLQWETGPSVLVGVVAGAILAGVLTRLVRSQLYGVGVVDPLSLGVVACTVIATAWIASYLPARRTKRLDLVKTLRDN